MYVLWWSPVEVPPAPRWRPRSRALSRGLRGQRAVVGGNLAGAHRWRGRGRRSTWWHYQGTQWQERSRSDASGGVGNATKRKHSSELLDLQVESPWKSKSGKDTHSVKLEHGNINGFALTFDDWICSCRLDALQVLCNAVTDPWHILCELLWWFLACVLLQDKFPFRKNRVEKVEFKYECI